MGAAVKFSDNLDVHAMLKNSLLFQGADETILNFAQQHLEPVKFSKGDPIVLENEPNDHVYFIYSGAVEIVNYVSEDKRVQRLALLKPGSNFAEFSVLTRAAKSGSAYAYEDSYLLRMHGDRFLEILKKFPSVSKKLVKDLADLNMRVEVMNDFIPFYNPSQLTVTREAADVLPQPTWTKFKTIPLHFHAGVLSVAMQDPFNDQLYNFLHSSYPNLEIQVFLISGGEFESAVDYAVRWLKSPQGTSHQKTPDSPIKDIAELLSKCVITAELPDNVKQQLLSYLKPTEVKAGQVIAKPGAALEVLHIVQKGKLVVSRSVPRCKGMIQVFNLGPGDTFGETSCLSGRQNAHFVRADEDTTVVTIPKVLLEQLLATPLFTLPMAKALALRLQKLGHISGMRYFKTDQPLDFRRVVNLLPYSLITEHQILPLLLNDNEISVGAVHPDSGKVMALIGRYLVDYRVKILGITEEQFKGFYQQFKMLGDQIGGTNFTGSSSSIKTSQVDAVKVLDEILLTGLSNRCSDIHFEPTEKHLVTRYRIDGVMVERPEKIPNEMAKEIISRLKILSNMDISQQKIPQDGQLKAKIGEAVVIARSSSLPIKYGEKIVLRIIRSKNNIVPLNMLAPDRRAIKILQAIANCSQGLFLVTGPTGSGKTTTLYSLLNEINRVDVNVITLEDPVEMEISGFNQCEIDRKRGLDFGLALRSVLRQDPDVVMVGEIRDEETAKTVFEAAITGHLVLSTLHTSSSLDVAARLKELGVPPATMAAGLLGVLTQRLIRALCKKCSYETPTTASEADYIRSILGESVHVPEKLKRSKGCPACSGSGYFDRIPVLEIWRSTLPMRKALMEEMDLQKMLEVARQDGFENLLEFGVRLCLSGLTTIDEVKRCLSNV